MLLQDDSAYLAFVARDARFDGRLFVGVTSTGIYCRPVCRVRTPRRENCRFYDSAASAENGGFRPCLRCRPELAPGLALIDSPQVLAHHAARMLSHAACSGDAVQLPALAQRLGVTDRHLRRIFADVHGVSPIDYLTTQRLMLAKQLLTDTQLPITQVALRCGFGSVRRFNAVFAQRCRLNPSALRREGRAPNVQTPARARGHVQAQGQGPMRQRLTAAKSDDALTVRLGFRPPFDGTALLRFFADRALAGIEVIEGDVLRRTLGWTQAGTKGEEHIVGWLTLRVLPPTHEIEVKVAPSFVPHLGAVLERVRHALDLDADPLLIDPVLASLEGLDTTRAGTRVPGAMDGFETAVRVILSQQVTVAAARTLTRRLMERYGEDIVTPWPDLTRLFPTPLAIARADAATVGRLGIVRQRVGALQALARAVCAGQITLHRGAPLGTTLDALRALPGVGEWTVQLIAMRALAWPDAFAPSDIGVLKALGTRKVAEATQRAEAFRPWRAYAMTRWWQNLENSQ